MLIFVSGHHAIYGTQILYFTDPVLSKRALIAPPTRFVAIDDGKIVKQLPADRTRNVISAPEPRRKTETAVPTPKGPLSAMERAFLKELGQPAPEVPTATPAGFVEQLDLDLHEADIQEQVEVAD
jgi:hypothetical protein